MNVSLTPQLEKLVKKKVKLGQYNSASEVVRESLRLMDRHDRVARVQIKELRARIARGIQAIEAGNYVEVDQAGLRTMFDDIKARGRRTLAALKRKRV